MDQKPVLLLAYIGNNQENFGSGYYKPMSMTRLGDFQPKRINIIRLKAVVAEDLRMSREKKTFVKELHEGGIDMTVGNS